jgi:hypothetical protein
MLTVLVFLAVTSGVVCLIEWNSNRNYYGAVQLHEIAVVARFKTVVDRVAEMPYEQVVDTLVENRVCVLLNGDLYFNSIRRAVSFGYINKLDATWLLAYKMGGMCA